MKAQFKRDIAELQELIDQLNPIFKSNDYPEVKIEFRGSSFCLKLLSENNLCLNGHWSEEYINLCISQLKGILLAFSIINKQ